MHLFRQTRLALRLTAAITALALAVLGFLPAAKHASAATGELTLEQALSIICSAAGTRGPTGPDGAPPMRPGDACPLCPAFSGPAVAAPPVLVPATPVWRRIALAPAPAAAPRGFRAVRRFQPRAPPFRSLA